MGMIAFRKDRIRIQFPKRKSISNSTFLQRASRAEISGRHRNDAVVWMRPKLLIPPRVSIISPQVQFIKRLEIISVITLRNASRTIGSAALIWCELNPAKSLIVSVMFLSFRRFPDQLPEHVALLRHWEIEKILHSLICLLRIKRGHAQRLNENVA